MKKQIIAAAVAAAFAVPAAAQVTISGRVDQSLGNGTSTADKKANRVNSSLLTTSQLVITGSEDLGGGLKANLYVSSQLAPDTGTFSWGNRGFTVGLSGKFGAVTIGKDAGSAIDAIATSAVVNNLGNYSVLNNRVNNSISYTSPSFSGMTARVIYTAGNDDGTDDTAKKQNRLTEVSATYVGGPLTVRLAQSKTSMAAIATAATATNSFGTTASTAASTRDDVSERGIQANYNAGFALINARYVERTTEGAETGTGLRDQNATGYGASIPVAGVALNLDYLKLDHSTATSSFAITSATVVKELSKRTNVYGAYSAKDYDDTAKNTESIYAIGVRHSF